MTDWRRLAEQVSQVLGTRFQLRQHYAIGGGCINSTQVITDGHQNLFVKLNDARHQDMFTAEAAGLLELAAAGSLEVPRPLCAGLAGASAFLVMEFIDMGDGGSAGPEALGRGLAALHRVTRPAHGWWRDNYIGTTPQPNARSDDWVTFWAERRLGHQLRLAAGQGHGGKLQLDGERLLQQLPAFFTDYHPAPSLLHGDLWSGNYAFSAAGRPVIFDPAVYCGDRETDIAMTELFGGFAPRFYAAYREAWPLDPGYGVRKLLYNLYHVLNHLNLFGGGYRAQAEGLLARLLSEAG